MCQFNQFLTLKLILVLYFTEEIEGIEELSLTLWRARARGIPKNIELIENVFLALIESYRQITNK